MRALLEDRILNGLKKTVEETLHHRYRFEGWLGHGQATFVVAVRERSLDHVRAMRILRPSVGTAHEDIRHAATQHFQRQPRVLAGLAHQNVVQMFEAGMLKNLADPFLPATTPVHSPFYVMECVTGQELGEFLISRSRAATLRPLDLLNIVAQIGNAFEAIDAAGIVNCDVAPSSIRVRTGDLRVKLTNVSVEPATGLYGIGRTLREVIRFGGACGMRRANLSSLKLIADRLEESRSVGQLAADLRKFATQVQSPVRAVVVSSEDQESGAGRIVRDAARLALADQIRRLIDDHFMEHFTIGRLAQRLHRSRSQIASIFRERYGMSIHDYLTQRRVRAAVQALETSDAKVEAVALDSGYRSKKDLYRVIKATTGLTPAKLRTGRQE